MKPNRWTEFNFRNNKTSKNRVVVPAMASQTADENGTATQKTFQHYSRLAESNAGLIFVEYSYVHPTGRSESNQLGAHAESQILGLSRIAKIIQARGALAGLQLVHGGGKSTTSMTGAPLLAPSSVLVPVKGWEPDVPVEMNHQQIEEWKHWFVKAAERTLQAGFDFVEIHAAHGYGFNQWLSPITNQRSDSFGGTLENRSRLLIETVREIRQKFPALLISVRIPGQDNHPGGLTIAEMVKVVKALEKAGVDLINVSSGIGGWRRPDGKAGEGYLVEDAAKIKAHIKLPVVGVGGIENGSTIDEMLSHAQIDFAAVGRAILKDPPGWACQNLILSCEREAL